MIHWIDELLKQPRRNFILYVGNIKLVKRKELEQYLSKFYQRILECKNLGVSKLRDLWYNNRLYQTLYVYTAEMSWFYGQRFKRKRAIEGNIRPETLQVILGHSNVGITMNLYVHVTEDEKVKEVEKIEKALKIV